MLGEVIAIGDELTSGQRLDTNSQWLSQRLGDRGIEVRFHTTVGDDMAANVAVFRAAFERADVVVSTGGLGPTADDLTRQALAEAVGVQLVEDAAALRYIRSLYEKRGRKMPERNALQAQFPAGATRIHNPNGTAPGFSMEIERGGRTPCRVFALPGVPAEMYEMWSATVEPAVRDTQDEPRVTVHRRIKCFGVGESNLEAMLPDLIRRGREPRVGITASKATLTLRVTATGPDAAACDAAIAPTFATIRTAVGDLAFGEEDDELQDVVVRRLAERGKKLVVVDAATDGLLGHWLATADAQRRTLLSACTTCGKPDSEQQAGIVAAEILKRDAADYALTTGVLRPTGHAEDGEAPIAIATREGTRTFAYTTAGHPSIVKHRLAKQALDLLRRTLLGLPISETR